MTNRELLELAAKAFWAGEIDDVVSIEWGELDKCILYTHADNQDHNGHDRAFQWNPLEDDGDALRLAVELRISIDFCSSWFEEDAIGIAAMAMDESAGEYRHALEDLPIADYCAATRRAIVRAAATLGAQA